MSDNNNFKDRNPQTLMSARLSLLIVFFVFSVVVFLSLVSAGALFGTAGKAINSFILGSFGHSAYPLFVSAIIIAVKFMRGSRVNAGRRNVSCFLIMFFTAVLCYHQLTSAAIFNQSENLSGYLLSCFNAASEGAGQATGGGVVFALVLYPAAALFGITGSYILLCLIFGIALAVLIYSRRLNLSAGYKVSGVKEYPSDYFVPGPQMQPQQPQQQFAQPQQKSYVLPDFPDQKRVLGMEKQHANLKLDEQEELNPAVEQVSKKLFVGFIDDYVNPRKRSAKQERSYDILYSSKNAKTPQAQEEKGGYSRVAPANADAAQDAQKLGGSSYIDTFGDDIESKKKYILTPIDLLRPESDYGYFGGGNSSVYPLNLTGDKGSGAKPTLINHGTLGGLPKTPEPGALQRSTAPPMEYRNINTDQSSGTFYDAGSARSGQGSGSAGYGQKNPGRPQGEKGAQPPHSQSLSQYQKYANENPEGNAANNTRIARPDKGQSYTGNKLNSLMEKYSGLANEKSAMNDFGKGPDGTPLHKPGSDLPGLDGYMDSRSLPNFKYSSDSGNDSGNDSGGTGARQGKGAGYDNADGNVNNSVNDNADNNTNTGSGNMGADIMRFDDAARQPADSGYNGGQVNNGYNADSGARFPRPSQNSGYEDRQHQGMDMPDTLNSQNPALSGKDTDFRKAEGLQEIKVQTQVNIKKDKKPVIISPYVAPHTSLLNDIVFDPNEVAENYEEKVAILEQALEDFKVPAKVVTVTPGPAVTRYELQMPPGVPVSRLTSRANDIAMYLASSGEIRIEAPIPGKSLLGIELPNKKRAKVGLKEVIDSQEFLNNKSPVAFALGKDIAGKNIIVDFTKMPHLLVAGSTGSGKSVCLNTLIISLLYKSSPEDVRLILIDPKRVEFNVYNGLPHLMLKDVITETEKAISAFNWAINEMDRRFELFKNIGAKDIIAYNEKVKKTDAPKLPRIMIIVDELAELMMINKRELEDKIKKISQLSRAAGIHLILATQRPSVDIITGVIKANLSSRVTFKLMTQADSRTILDSSGAEKLLGEGDMIFITSSMPKPVRLQGPYVSMGEVESIVEFIKENNESYFDDDIAEKILNPVSEQPEEADTDAADEQDKYFYDALRLAIDSGQISISMVQRKFSVGYSRAGKIIDEMERHNYITPFEGSKPRQVLISRDEFERRFGDRE